MKIFQNLDVRNTLLILLFLVVIIFAITIIVFLPKIAFTAISNSYVNKH